MRALALWLAVTAIMMAPAMSCAPSGPSESSSAGRTPRSNIPDPAPDAPGRRTAPIRAASDPCAERLHALAGTLLFYYALNRRLPVDIVELRDVAGLDPAVGFTCPVSGKPYVYDPSGLPRGGDRPGFIVMSDPEPSHSGMRWAVVVEEPKGPTQPLVTKVVAEEELTFHAPQ